MIRPVTLFRRVLTGVAAVGLIVTMTACGSGGGNDAGSAGTDGATGAGYPVTIDSTLGAVTLKARPQRVVTLGWGSNDAALALGVVPVGMSSQVPASGGETPWAKARFDGQKPVVFDADSGTIPYEKIASLRPDLILAVYSGVTDSQYATLSKIAPTVGYPGKAWSTSWQDQLSIVGKALGRSDQAAALEKKVATQIAQVKSQHPEFAGKTAIFGSGTQAGSYNLYLPDDPRMTLLSQFGFTVSDAATTTFPHSSDMPTFATSVSLEQLPKLNTDVLVSWYLSDSTRSSIENQAVFTSLPAVRDGAYVPITDPFLLFATSAPNVLSIPWMLDRYVPLLSAAAKKAG